MDAEEAARFFSPSPPGGSNVSGKSDGRLSPYDVLGIPTDALIPDIKAAYRAALLRFHPDKWAAQQQKTSSEHRKSDESAEIDREQWLQLSIAAARVLLDPCRRATFDQDAAQAAARAIGRVSDTVPFSDFELDTTEYEDKMEVEEEDEGEGNEYIYACRCGGDYTIVGELRAGQVAHAECDVCCLVIEVTSD